MHRVEEATSELGPEARVGVWCMERRCRALGTACAKTWRWRSEGGLGRQCVCPTRRGDGPFQGAVCELGSQHQSGLGRGGWECPSEKPQHTCLPQASWPSPPPQVGTHRSFLGPAAAVCAQHHQVAPSHLGLVPLGVGVLPPVPRGVPYVSGAFSGPLENQRAGLRAGNRLRVSVAGTVDL